MWQETVYAEFEFELLGRAGVELALILVAVDGKLCVPILDESIFERRRAVNKYAAVSEFLFDRLSAGSKKAEGAGTSETRRWWSLPPRFAATGSDAFA